MIEHQQDADGVVSCRYRLPPDDDPNTIGWCMLRKEPCQYCEDCRVTIPTNLSLVVNAAEELVTASHELVEIMVDLGYDREGSCREDLDAARKALTTVKAILKHQEEA